MSDLGIPHRIVQIPKNKNTPILSTNGVDLMSYSSRSRTLLQSLAVDIIVTGCGVWRKQMGALKFIITMRLGSGSGKGEVRILSDRLLLVPAPRKLSPAVFPGTLLVFPLASAICGSVILSFSGIERKYARPWYKVLIDSVFKPTKF